MKKFFAAAMILMLLTTLLAGLPRQAGSFADEEATVHPLWYDRYVRRDEDALKSGSAAQFQIHTRQDVQAVTLNICAVIAGDFTGEGIGFEAEAYKWDTNILKTLEGAPLYSGKCVSYMKTEADSPIAVTCDFGSSPLPAGEYVVSFRLVSEATLLLSRFLPAPLGVRSYIDGRSDYGSFAGSIEFTEPSKSPLTSTSINKDLVYHETPAEPTLSPDSAIVTLDVDSTKWGAVDGLGRTLPSENETGAKKDKLVGIFYWTWHLQNSGGSEHEPNNINNILKEYPEATNDYYHEVWQRPACANFWNEPLWGYYTEEDDYVLRKHAELLADAGIDFVMFDCTNGDLVWTSAYLNLLKVWSKAREDGVNTPKIGFMMQFGYSGNTRSSLWQVYTTIYKKGLYQDLWFYWDGKPLVMAWETGLDANVANEAELLSFFTYRHPIASYFSEDGDDSCWGWLSTYPQAVYRNEDGTAEMTTVGIAQNANYETQGLSAMNSGRNMGRSYAGDKNYSYSYWYRWQKITVNAKTENGKLYGRNFQEQWDYALKVDPEIVFVTGWNEWIMGRYEEWCGVANAFPDQCDDENSRDIEPSKGDLKDYYYYQLVANVRRFKGMSERDYQPSGKTIDLDKGTDQWNDPAIVTNNHSAHNTLERNFKGFGSTHYTGEALRNDFVQAKVSYDSKNVWFYVKTENGITPYEDGGWMTLLIDAGAATPWSKDWEEFEFIIGREGTTDTTMRLEKSTGGWNWETVGDVKYKVYGNEMVIEVPRKLLGSAGRKLDFGYKWVDDNIGDGDILRLYTEGDAAPGGRFVFLFAAKPSPPAGTALIIAAAAVLAAAGAVLAAVLTIKRKRGAAGDGSKEVAVTV